MRPWSIPLRDASVSVVGLHERAVLEDEESENTKRKMEKQKAPSVGEMRIQAQNNEGKIVAVLWEDATDWPGGVQQSELADLRTAECWTVGMLWRAGKDHILLIYERQGYHYKPVALPYGLIKEIRRMGVWPSSLVP